MLCRKRHFISILAALVLATAFAQAQKPALTKSVDEPGRSPYTSNVVQSCPLFSCSFVFKPVPVGFRLVVTHASVWYKTDSTSGVTYALLSQTPSGQSYREYLPLPTLTGSRYVVSSSPVTYYVEPGQTPQIDVTNSLEFPGEASISGYLVAIP